MSILFISLSLKQSKEYNKDLLFDENIYQLPTVALHVHTLDLQHGVIRFQETVVKGDVNCTPDSELEWLQCACAD